MWTIGLSSHGVITMSIMLKLVAYSMRTSESQFISMSKFLEMNAYNYFNILQRPIRLFVKSSDSNHPIRTTFLCSCLKLTEVSDWNFCFESICIANFTPKWWRHKKKRTLSDVDRSAVFDFFLDCVTFLRRSLKYLMYHNFIKHSSFSLNFLII